MIVAVGADRTVFTTDSGAWVVPIGHTTAFEADPPRADELTNVIGSVQDHLDDVLRELPDAIDATVEVTGVGVTDVADVEVGAAATLPMVLGRDAAEDVFRTVATERRARRALNPGLAPERVDAVLGAACILVAVMRRLHLDEVLIVDDVSS